MVRTPQKDHIGPRPPIHVPLWPIPGKGTWHQLEPLIGSSPPDRWTIRKKEPMGRTISAPRHSQPTSLEQVPCNRHSCPQQFKKCLNWIRTKQTPYRIGTSAHTRTNHIGQQPTSRKNSRTITPTPNPRHHSPEQPRKQQSPDRSTLQTRPTSLAGSQESGTTLWNNKTRTKTTWTLQNHKNHLPCGVQIGTPPPMEHPPGIPRIPPYPICQNNRTWPQLLPTTT